MFFSGRNLYHPISRSVITYDFVQRSPETAYDNFIFPTSPIQRLCIAAVLQFDRAVVILNVRRSCAFHWGMSRMLSVSSCALVLRSAYQPSLVCHLSRVFSFEKSRGGRGPEQSRVRNCSAAGRVWMVSRLRLTRAMQPAVPCPCVWRTRGLGKSAGLLDLSRNRHAYLFVVLTPTARERRYK